MAAATVPATTVPAPAFKKAALLFVKVVPYTKDGKERALHIGTCIDSVTNEPLELIAQAPFTGASVFYKTVQIGEEMWAGRLAEKVSNVYLGSALTSDVQATKVTLTVLSELAF